MCYTLHTYLYDNNNICTHIGTRITVHTEMNKTTLCSRPLRARACVYIIQMYNNIIISNVIILYYCLRRNIKPL